MLWVRPLKKKKKRKKNLKCFPIKREERKLPFLNGLKRKIRKAGMEMGTRQRQRRQSSERRAREAAWGDGGGARRGWRQGLPRRARDRRPKQGSDGDPDTYGGSVSGRPGQRRSQWKNRS